MQGREGGREGKGRQYLTYRCYSYANCTKAWKVCLLQLNTKTFERPSHCHRRHMEHHQRLYIRIYPIGCTCCRVNRVAIYQLSLPYFTIAILSQRDEQCFLTLKKHNLGGCSEQLLPLVRTALNVYALVQH